jgi:hypothetical protein
VGFQGEAILERERSRGLKTGGAGWNGP